MFFEKPSSISLIDSYAFNECESLKQIIIPSSTTNIKKYAFDRCSSLQQIAFENPNGSVAFLETETHSNEIKQILAALSKYSKNR